MKLYTKIIVPNTNSKQRLLPLIFPVLGLILGVLGFFFNDKLCLSFIFELGFIRVIYDKFDIKKPTSAFILPWLVLYCFINFPITNYQRSVSTLTLQLITIPVFFSLLFSPELFNLKVKIENFKLYKIKHRPYRVMKSLCIVLFFANVAYSGYLPLIRTIGVANSDYLDYGIKGINGLFYAFSNAFALLSFFLYIETKEKKYLYNILIIIGIFLLCLTRQNLVSLLVEMYVFYIIRYKSISKAKLIFSVILFLVCFSALGELRSGDIREIMGLKKEWYWLPSSFIWIYSYGYFNVLNLDNIIANGSVGLFNGASTASLLPSFLRPKFESQDSLLEVINFNISSYISPILEDWGISGVFIFSACVILITVIVYKYALKKKSFKIIGCFSVLLFCALFSFFVNFWFYLPIIFQIPFIIYFDKKILVYDK